MTDSQTEPESLQNRLEESFKQLGLARETVDPDYGERTLETEMDEAAAAELRHAQESIAAAAYLLGIDSDRIEIVEEPGAISDPATPDDVDDPQEVTGGGS